MAIEGDKMFTIVKWTIVGLLLFDLACIHFSFLAESLDGAPGDLIAFGVFFTFTLILFPVAYFALITEHLWALAGIVIALTLDLFFLFFIPLHPLAISLYVLLLLALAGFAYLVHRGGVNAVLNQP